MKDDLPTETLFALWLLDALGWLLQRLLRLVGVAVRLPPCGVLTTRIYG